MKTWIVVNLWAQVIILFLALIALAIEPLLAMALAIPFGLWQVIAGIVFAVRNDKLSQDNRAFVNIYLVVTAAVTGVFVIAISTNLNFKGEETLFGIFGVTSAVLGISFFVFSFRLLKNEPQDNRSLPDILDQI